jgi:hypothetical protein
VDRATRACVAFHFVMEQAKERGWDGWPVGTHQIASCDGAQLAAQSIAGPGDEDKVQGGGRSRLGAQSELTSLQERVAAAQLQQEALRRRSAFLHGKLESLLQERAAKETEKERLSAELHATRDALGRAQHGADASLRQS